MNVALGEGKLLVLVSETMDHKPTSNTNPRVGAKKFVIRCLEDAFIANP
jgi:hypothetical protein